MLRRSPLPLAESSPLGIVARVRASLPDRPDLAGLPVRVWVLVGTSFVVAIGYGIVAPALPTFARSFDVSIAAVSAVVSAFALFRLVFAPISGWLVGRVSELSVFCAGLVVVAASSAACAFAEDYWQLLLFRAVGGIGSTMFTVAAAALLIRLAPPSVRGRAIGAWATGFLAGTVGGPLVGGALMAISLRAPFLAYAALLVVAVVLSVVALRQEPGTASHTGQASTGAVTQAGTFTAAMGSGTFRAALTSNFVHGWTVYGVWIALVPLYTVEMLHLSSSWAGAFLAASAAGTALTLLRGGRVADARGRKVPVRIGLGITAIGALIPVAAASTPTFLLAAVLIGAGAGLMEPAMNAAVGDVVTQGRQSRTGGSAIAGFEMVGDVGAVLGPLLAGLIAQTGGFDYAFAATAVLAAGSWFCWQRAPESVPRPLTATS